MRCISLANWPRLLLTLASIAAMLAACLGLTSLLARPLTLTYIHGSELKPSIDRYYELSNTEQGWKNPETISRIATGARLRYLMTTRCQSCAILQVTTAVKVTDLQVLEYSQDRAKVGVHVEMAWHLVDTKTGLVLGSCHTQAYNEAWILARESGDSKVADGSEAFGWERNNRDDTPDLLAKYCRSK